MTDNLIITDASLLMTLAAANELNALLVNRRLTIPDAVYGEAANLRFPDGQRIDAWVKAHADQIDIPKTVAGAQREALIEAGEPARNLGEVAAFEVATKYLSLHTNDRVILIYEDPHVPRLASAIADPRIELTNTGNYLLALEQAGQIPSALSVLNKAQDAGRNVDAQLHAVSQVQEKDQHRALLQSVIPNHAASFDFRHQHPDGVMTFQHKETHGLLHIDPEGQTVSKHGESISPQKALESALAPAQEKSNGAGKANDPGPGLGM